MQENHYLNHLRVLDLADDKAGFCSKLLADLGADVIKVKRPDRRRARDLQPPDPWRLYFNHNKRLIVMDLGEERCRKSFLGLVRGRDILVETFSPGRLEGWGLGDDRLRRENPRLIHATVSDFGDSGPKTHLKGGDIVASAFGGHMGVTGPPQGPPLRLYGKQSYYATSLFTACAVLLAVHKRRLTGRGEHLHIPLHEAVTSTLEHVLVRYFGERTVPGRTGGNHWDDLFFHLPCKDGFLEISIFQHWDTLVELMDRDGAAGDLAEEMWRDRGYRRENKDRVLATVAAWAKRYARRDLFEMGQAMHFPWAPIQGPQDILSCPHLRERGYFTRETIGGRTLSFPGLPFRSSVGLRTKRPLLFQDAGGAQKPCEPGDPGNRRSADFGDPFRRDPSMPDQGDARILRGIRVLDFTRVLAGPYATRVLADFGAEVIKVEPPRSTPSATTARDAYFETWNRNKLSITVDMGQPRGVILMKRLIRVCDVLVENFAPRVMANWGLSYGVLQRIQPELIMLSMSGFGHSGPWKNYVAYAPTVHALGGITHLTALSEDAPLGPGFAYGDVMAGLFGAFALLGALENRRKTGSGRFIDLSEYEVICSLMGPALLRTSMGQGRAVPEGNCPPGESGAPCGCYPCLGEDRWLVLEVRDETQWEALCRVVDPSLASDGRFISEELRKDHRDELDAFIRAWTRKRSPREAVALLQAWGVPAGVVQNAREVAKDTQHRARNFFVELEGAGGGTVTSDRTPLWGCYRVPPPWRGAPAPGASNDYVFREILGMSEEDYSSYKAAGVIGE